jgi:hypothetical protein
LIAIREFVARYLFQIRTEKDDVELLLNAHLFLDEDLGFEKNIAISKNEKFGSVIQGNSIKI